MLSVKSFIFWQFKSTPVHMSANVYSKMCCWKGQQVYQNPSDLFFGTCECLWQRSDPCGRYWDVSQDEWKFAGGEGNVRESQNLWGFIWDISLKNSTWWWSEEKGQVFNRVRFFLWKPWVKVQGTLNLSLRVHPLGTMDICTTSQENPSSSFETFT